MYTLTVFRSSSLVSDNGATFSRIKIYGALPALGSVHNLDVPFYVNERSGKLYQRGALNTYTFDIVEDDVDESTLEEFFEKEELDEAA